MLKTQDKSLTKVDNSRGSARSASFPRSNSRSNESSDFSINRLVMLTPGFCISETDWSQMYNLSRGSALSLIIEMMPGVLWAKFQRRLIIDLISVKAYSKCNLYQDWSIKDRELIKLSLSNIPSNGWRQFLLYKPRS